MTSASTRITEHFDKRKEMKLTYKNPFVILTCGWTVAVALIIAGLIGFSSHPYVDGGSYGWPGQVCVYGLFMIPIAFYVALGVASSQDAKNAEVAAASKEAE
jgi:hypothetical protein